MGMPALKASLSAMVGKLGDGDTITNTVKARGHVYGDFSDNAVVAQAMKDAVRRGIGYNRLRPVHREAIDVIISKISRIVTGDPEYKDNWHDIQGYAKITEDRCK